MNEIKKDKKETINKIDDIKNVESKTNNKVNNKTSVKSGKEKKSTSSGAKNKKENNNVDNLCKSKVASTKVDAESNTNSSVNPNLTTQTTANPNINQNAELNINDNTKTNDNVNLNVSADNQKIGELASNFKKINERKSKKLTIIASVLLVLTIISGVALAVVFGKATKILATINAKAYVCHIVDGEEQKELIDQGKKTFVPIEESKSYSIANISSGVLSSTQYIKVEYNIKNENNREISIKFDQQFTNVNNCQMTYFVDGKSSEEKPTSILIVDLKKGESMNVWFYVKVIDSSSNASFSGQITVNVAYRYGNQ